ncbi:28S ribosomal protein S25, mitochondrial [Bulinus truncatus]|nr:28S ribosomal protein S25, mitochondrial [Bulinus truncatus]
MEVKSEVCSGHSKVMAVPEIRMSLDPSPSSADQHHQHHHHHHHLTRLTGKGGDATGKRVVVGVDGSEHSKYACEWYFSHLWSSEDYVVLLNCPDLHDVVKNHLSSGKYVFDRELVDQRLKEGEETLHHELERFKEILLRHSAHGKVRAVTAKNPGDAILKTADEERCDLIVIGCKGRSALRRTLLGTISDYVVHHANVPVVVCRNKALRRKSSAIIPPNPEELLGKTLKRNPKEVLNRMPFMKGAAPIRRTLKYLENGKLLLKDNVRMVAFNFNQEHPPSAGAEKFVFWHFAQMQYKNPNVNMYVFNNMTPSPYIQFFCNGGKKMVLDVDSQDKETIFNQVKKIFCKSDETLQAESVAKEKKSNPANFGYMCSHECICEIPGQIPCTKWCIPPKEQRGKFKFLGKDVEPE